MEEWVEILLPVLGMATAFFVVAWLGGMVIEDFTNQRIMKWVWWVVMALTAVFMGLSMYGVGWFYEHSAQQATERRAAAGGHGVGNLPLL